MESELTVSEHRCSSLLRSKCLGSNLKAFAAEKLPFLQHLQPQWLAWTQMKFTDHSLIILCTSFRLILVPDLVWHFYGLIEQHTFRSWLVLLKCEVVLLMLKTSWVTKEYTVYRNKEDRHQSVEVETLAETMPLDASFASQILCRVLFWKALLDKASALSHWPWTTFIFESDGSTMGIAIAHKFHWFPLTRNPSLPI